MPGSGAAEVNVVNVDLPSVFGGVQLSAEELDEKEIAASKITVQGGRYPEKLEQLTGR